LIRELVVPDKVDEDQNGVQPSKGWATPKYYSTRPAIYFSFAKMHTNAQFLIIACLDILVLTV